MTAWLNSLDIHDDVWSMTSCTAVSFLYLRHVWESYTSCRGLEGFRFAFKIPSTTISWLDAVYIYKKAWKSWTLKKHIKLRKFLFFSYSLYSFLNPNFPSLHGTFRVVIFSVALNSFIYFSEFVSGSRFQWQWCDCIVRVGKTLLKTFYKLKDPCKVSFMNKGLL